MKGILITVACAGALLCAGLAAFAANKIGAADNSAVVTRTFELGEFDEIEVSNGIKVELTQEPAKTAVLKAPANIIDNISIVNKGGELEVQVINSHFNRGKIEATLTVSSSNVSKIKTETAGSVSMAKLVNYGKVELDAETAGMISIERLECGSAEMEAETAAGIKIGTIVNKGVLEASAETAAGITIGGGEAGNVDLKAETAGSINIKAVPTGGKAGADTGGSVKVATAKLRLSTSTGGSVKDWK